jgi:hypothetical protein
MAIAWSSTSQWSEPALLEKAVFGTGEAQVFAQGLALVFAAEEAAALYPGLSDDAMGFSLLGHPTILRC